MLNPVVSAYPRYDTCTGAGFRANTSIRFVPVCPAKSTRISIRPARISSATRPCSQPAISLHWLAQLRRRLAERGLRLELSDAAKEAVAEAGWDPAYGARPLKRALQRLVENPLALRLLEGDFGDGDTIRVDAQDGELVFTRAEAAAAAA